MALFYPSPFIAHIGADESLAFGPCFWSTARSLVAAPVLWTLASFLCDAHRVWMGSCSSSPLARRLRVLFHRAARTPCVLLGSATSRQPGRLRRGAGWVFGSSSS